MCLSVLEMEVCLMCLSVPGKMAFLLVTRWSPYGFMPVRPSMVWFVDYIDRVVASVPVSHCEGGVAYCTYYMPITY